MQNVPPLDRPRGEQGIELRRSGAKRPLRRDCQLPSPRSGGRGGSYSNGVGEFLGLHLARLSPSSLQAFTYV